MRQQTNMNDTKELLGLPGGSVVKNLPANVGDTGSISGLGRSPGKGNGNPLQYSCLVNPMDRGAWQAYSPLGCKRVGQDWATKQQRGIIAYFSRRDHGLWLCCLFQKISFVVVQLLSRVQLFATPWTTVGQAFLSFTISQNLLKLISCSNSCPLSQWCHSTISSSAVPFSSSLQFFLASGSALYISWPKYWSFSFSISFSNEYTGLTSFRMEWLDLLVVQRILKSLFQYHSSKASIFHGSTFFMVQLSHSYMTTGKIIALTIQTFVGKVKS